MLIQLVKGYKLAIITSKLVTFTQRQEEELSSAERQAVVDNNYGKLKSAFNSF